METTKDDCINFSLFSANEMNCLVDLFFIPEINPPGSNVIPTCTMCKLQIQFARVEWHHGNDEFSPYPREVMLVSSPQVEKGIWVKGWWSQCWEHPQTLSSDCAARRVSP